MNASGDIYMGASPSDYGLKVTQAGAVSVNDGAYTFPTAIGSAGQVLRVPASGTTLEWGTGSDSQWTDVTNGLTYTKSINNYGGIEVINGTAGTAARARIAAVSNDGHVAELSVNSTTFTTSGLRVADQGMLYSANLLIASNGNAMRFTTNLGANEALRLNTDHSVTISNAYTLPTGLGTNGQALMTYGDGGTYWGTVSGGGGMTNPMTSAGDLIVGASGGTPARLGIGANGTYLRSNGSSASWSGFTADVRSQLSAGTGISYNSSTGVISATGGAGQDGTFTTLSQVTTNATTTNVSGSMTVSNGDAGNFEITVYAINSASNSSYHHKVIIPYLATSPTTMAFGTEISLIAPEALGSCGGR